MSRFSPRSATALALDGDPAARGRGQAAHPAADPARVRTATIGRVQAARAEGIVDGDAEHYLAAQRAFHDMHDPAGMAELGGIAEGFGLDAGELFVHLHLGTLRDLKSGARLESDGCSAWAVPYGPEGPLLVKNRDYSGVHLGIQHVAIHRGPDLRAGDMLCVGSLGSPGAYSSGMNSAGLALADTQVAVATHRVGWLRYFLMSRLLAECRSVDEALTLLRGVPHAGGGTLVMADRYGDIAAVELAAQASQDTKGAVVWRTNHYVFEEKAAETLFPQGDRVAGNSAARFAYLEARLPRQTWDKASAAELMAIHEHSAAGAAPLCQHSETEASQTLSTSIYSCKLGSLTFSEGNPCAGNWLTYGMPT